MGFVANATSPQPPVSAVHDDKEVDNANSISSSSNNNIFKRLSQTADQNNTTPSSPQAESIAGSESSEKPSFKKWFSFMSASTENLNVKDSLQKLATQSNYNLAYFRFQRNNREMMSKSAKDQESMNASANSLRRTFNEIKTGIEYTNNEVLIQSIDWEFWSRVVNDYSSVVTEQSDELLEHITVGVPSELRGMVWQLISNSKSFKLEEFFRDSRLQTSDFEAQIKRDLARTNFITNSPVKAKVDDLFDIIKAYSLFDPEVGYTQGMAFITVPLLMNMDASESFCMLCKLMTNYGFRELYLPDMPGLHLKMYQFDRLIEDLLPELHIHLKRQGVRSSMYATQWFLTLFGYKFPLDMVLRIYDLVIAEGIECILKFAINLMMKNERALLNLNFDELLNFLKDKLFYYYIVTLDANGVASTGARDTVSSIPDSTKPTKITSDGYRLDEFVSDSMAIEILPLTLKRYAAEYEEINRLEKERTEEIEDLRSKNGYLTREIRSIEAAYATLNREHVEIANEMVQGKVQIATLEDDNKSLKLQIEELTGRLQLLEKQSDTKVDFSGEISDNMGFEIQRTMQRNLEVMEENRRLEESLAAVEKEFSETKAAMDAMKKGHKGWFFS
ncbi:unnamed protein product [Ambrosiozyma monospora]|uniref:Unnamed protein product n=1 Tax=Ambrosiozyma monospora TaxID=43982 RepID=A0ACB5T401_AMBMO|nr:unnamed protein product [Ambrosiozyma monospora]